MHHRRSQILSSGLLMLAPFSAQADSGPIRVAPPPAPLVIDGAPEAAWDAAPRNPIAQIVSGAVTDSLDLDASWQAFADSEALYLMLRAADDSRIAKAMGKVGRSDHFDVSIDLEGGAGGARRGPMQHRFRFDYEGPTGGALFDGTRWTGIEARQWPMRVSETQRAVIGWTVEVRIPWATLGGPSGRIGLQVVVSDFDGGKSTLPEAVVAARVVEGFETHDPRGFASLQLYDATGRPLPGRKAPAARQPLAGRVIFEDSFGTTSRGELVNNIVQLKPPLGMGYRSNHHRGYMPKGWVWAETNALDHPHRGFWAIAENEEVLVQAGRSIPSTVFVGTAVPADATHYVIEFSENRNDNDYIGYIVGASRPVPDHDGTEFGYETQVPLTDRTTPHVYFRGALGNGNVPDRAYPRQWARHRIEVRGQLVRWLIEDQVIVERTVPGLRAGGYFGITHRAERDTRYDDVRITVVSPSSFGT